jgi:hypothetical protein
METVAFVVIGSAIILGWVLVDGAVPYLEHTVSNIAHGSEFDAEPWILLNLIFSGVAFHAGALVIIAQKAQTRTDKASEEASAKHREGISNAQAALLQQNTDLPSGYTTSRSSCTPSPRRCTGRPAAERATARANQARGAARRSVRAARTGLYGVHTQII